VPRGLVAAFVAAVALAGCEAPSEPPPGGGGPGSRPGAPSGAEGSYNCDDFASHAEAQAYYEGQDGDPDGLDRDGDGEACEALP
jgi:hypothetical protein